MRFPNLFFFIVHLFSKSGKGKSALLANWLGRYKKHHPEVICISHFVGCTESSADHVAILRRILMELQFALGESIDNFKDSADMIQTFPHTLEKMLHKHNRQKLIVIIDGLDLIDDTNNARNLSWLPRQFPSIVRVIFSVGDSKMLSTMKKRQYETYELAGLKEAERVSFVRKYLALSSKRLSQSQELKIAKTPQTSNPRYLKTLVEDLVLFGVWEELEERIEQNL